MAEYASNLIMYDLITDLVGLRAGILAKEVGVAGHHACQLLSCHLVITTLNPSIKRFEILRNFERRPKSWLKQSLACFLDSIHNQSNYLAHDKSQHEIPCCL